ncbi:MAG: O-antigen ligase family protein [Bacteroidales bacterium]|nr:O-antigen ligase family protein [Bacteroidales bacterium]
MKKILQNLPIWLISLFIGIILPLIFHKKSFDPVLLPRLLGLSILVFILIITYFYFVWKQKINFQPTKKMLLLLIVMTGYILSSFISSFNAINFSEGIFETVKSSTIIMFFIFIVIAVNYNWKNINILIKSILILSLVIISIGIYQLSKVDFKEAIGHENYMAYYYTKALLVVKSTLALKNLFSSALFLSLPYLIFGVIFYKKYWRIISIILLVISLCFIIMLIARAVWISLAVSVVCGILLTLIYYIKKQDLWKIFIENKIKSFTISIITISIIGTIFYTFSYSELRFAMIFRDKVAELTDFQAYKQENIINAKRQTSTQTRLLAWYRSYKMFKENPIIGVGPGNWRVNLPKYGLHGYKKEIEYGKQNFQRAHNDFIWVLCETGIIGLFFYLLIFIIPLYFLLKNIFSSENKETRILSILLFSSLFGFMLLSSIDFPKERIIHNVLVFSGIAITISLKNENNKNIINIKKSRFLIFLIICFVISLISLKFNREKVKGGIHAAKIWALYIPNQRWDLVIREAKKINDKYYFINPNSTPIAYQTAIGKYSMNRLDDALKDFEIAYKHHPYHLTLLGNYATCYARLGNRDKAIQLYKEALDISPYFPDVLVNLAIVYYNQRKIEEAYDIIRKCGYDKKNKKYLQALEEILVKKIALIYYKNPNNKELQKRIIELLKNKPKLISIYKKSLDKNIPFENLIISNTNK